MQLEAYIHEEIQKVCPIVGMSFGVLEDKSTWQIRFADEATEEQKKSAQVLLDAFEWNEQTQKYAERKALKQEMNANPFFKAVYAQYKKENTQASFDDFMNYVDALEME